MGKTLFKEQLLKKYKIYLTRKKSRRIYMFHMKNDTLILWLQLIHALIQNLCYYLCWLFVIPINCNLLSDNRTKVLPINKNRHI